MRNTRWWVIVLLVATYTVPWPGATGPDPFLLMQWSLAEGASDAHEDRAGEQALPGWADARPRW